MARSARTLLRAALGAAVVAVLGLGAVEAFAAPAGGLDTARYCTLACTEMGCTCMNSRCVCV